MAPFNHHLLLLLLLLSLSSTSTFASSTSNPFTPKSTFLRYYARKIPRRRPLPSFFLSKLSPLSAAASSSFLSSTPSSLTSFCAAANLLCPSLSSPILPSPAPSSSPSSYSSYSNPHFSNYGTGLSGGSDTFSLYSPDSNLPSNSFRRYSRSSSSRPDSFSSYSQDGNVVTANFSSYASSSTSGSGSFSSYAASANVPHLTFTNYDSSTTARHRSFSSYSGDTNSGGQSFASYAKHSVAVPTVFTSYATDSNIIRSTFTSYAEGANAAADNFTSYGGDGNGPANNFRGYGDGGNSGAESFKLYREKANVGEDSFRSYAEHGNAASAEFESYGKSFNPGVDSFQGYGDRVGSTASNHGKIGFRTYAGENTTFKGYARSGVTFATYRNASAVPPRRPGSFVNKWVEPGKFFRESSLRNGAAMVMADVRDRMPRRSFLPRSITEKIPFSAMDVSRIFEVPMDTALGKAMVSTVAECLRPPSKGETKRCAASAEDIVDFAVSELGDDVVVSTTENVVGSGREILIGDVKGINGGKITKSVSCHQSLFPYLVYYCHSVPKVRVYEAEILDVASKKKINRGVAICHLDTSDWSPTHGAFVALGSSPGEIEVCHWIFEGDMTWTVAD